MRDGAVYLLWDDGVVVLKNEPLNVMGPETLLLYWLGLEQQALVICKESSTLIAIDQVHACTQNTDILQCKPLALKWTSLKHVLITPHLKWIIICSVTVLQKEKGWPSLVFTFTCTVWGCLGCLKWITLKRRGSLALSSSIRVEHCNHNECSDVAEP